MRRERRRRSGQTGTEYMLVVSVVVIAVVAAAYVFVTPFRDGVEELGRDVSQILAIGDIGGVGRGDGPIGNAATSEMGADAGNAGTPFGGDAAEPGMTAIGNGATPGMRLGNPTIPPQAPAMGTGPAAPGPANGASGAPP